MAKSQRRWIRLITIVAIAMVLSLITTQNLDYDIRPMPVKIHLHSKVEFKKELEEVVLKKKLEEKLSPPPSETLIQTSAPSSKIIVKESTRKFLLPGKSNSDKPLPPKTAVPNQPSPSRLTANKTLNSKTQVNVASNYKNKPLSSDTSCSITFPIKMVPKVPLINLRRDRFIFPILANGPNNQLMSFRETIYIAIRLNRTIVIPQFHKHRMDAQSFKVDSIDSRHRVDLNSVNKLVPVITIKEFKKICNSTYNAVFRTHSMAQRDYVRIFEYYGLMYTKNFDYSNIKEAEFPRNENFTKSKLLSFNSSASQIRELYGTNKTCSIYPWPFKTLKIDEVPPKPKKPESSFDLRKLNDTMLFSEIIRYAAPPPHINQLASEFIASKMNGKLSVAVHWRFDRDDWGLKCTGPVKWGKQVRHEMCGLLLGLNYEDLAMGILSRAQNTTVLEKTSKTIYIASPPSEMEIIEKVAEYLGKKGYKVYSGSDIREYWKEKYSSCKWIWPNVEDILSSTEMGICTNALVFYGSISSSWTSNVQLLRPNAVPKKYLENDDSIFRLVRKARKKRLNLTVAQMAEELQSHSTGKDATS